MVRIMYAVVLSLVLILGALPIATAFPEAPEEMFWYGVADIEGDDSDGCARMTDDVIASLTGGDTGPTPCDILKFEIGNTDTHLITRLTLATMDFGGHAADGHVDYEFTMDVRPGEEKFTIQSRLTADGEVAIPENGTNPQGWEEDVEVDASEGENQIRTAIPLSLIGSLMDGGEAKPHVSWLNLTNYNAHWDLFTPLDLPVGSFDKGQGDSSSGEELHDGNRVFVLQAYGDLRSPRVEPRLFDSASNEPELQIAESFETDPPSMDDDCVPWNGTCFMASQPITAHNNYHWTTPYTSVEFSLQAEGVSGTGELVIKSPLGLEIFRDSFGAGTTEFTDLLRPIEAGTLELSVQLDRYEGSFELLAKEGPAPEDGDGGAGGGSEDGGENNNQDTNGTGDPDANLDDSNGAPGPGIVVLLALLAGIVSLKRRR